MTRRHQRGQAMVEYAIAAAVLVGALFVADLPGGKTGAQYLADMVKAFYRGLSFFFSLP